MNKKLTVDQLAAIGRFYQLLSHRLEVEWKLEIMHLDVHKDGPALNVTIWIPEAQHFQSLDRVVEDAFIEADCPGYEWTGCSHDMQLVDGRRAREINFDPSRNGT